MVARASGRRRRCEELGHTIATIAIIAIIAIIIIAIVARPSSPLP